MGPAYEIIPDYLVPGVGNEGVATVLAGWIGVTALFLVVGGLAWLVYRRGQRSPQAGEGQT